MPFGRATPRRNSAGAHGPLAGALHLDEADGALAAGDGERVVEHLARRAAALDERRAEDLDALLGSAGRAPPRTRRRETARGRG